MVDRERYDEVHRLHADHLPHKEIARRVGCSQGSVSLYLRGIGSPYRCSGCAAQLIVQAELCGLCEAERTATADLLAGAAA